MPVSPYRSIPGQFYDPYRAPARSLPNQSNPGSVLGASTIQNTQKAGNSLPQPQPQQQQNNPNNALQQIPQFQAPDYDALINPALEALDQAIAPAQSEYSANVAGIDAQANTQKGRAQQALTSAETRAGTARSINERTTNSAIDEARRQYAEQQQGLQARYGGTTGTGKFASEIAGAQSLRSIGQLRQGLTAAQQQISDALEQVRGSTTVALQDIEDQAFAQKQQAKSALDQALNQIRIAKGELQGNKAKYANDAIQQYQQVVNSINSANAQYKQQLALQQAQAEQKLQSALSKAQTTANGYSLVNIPQKSQGTLIFDKSTGTYTPIGGGSFGQPDDENTDFFANQ